MDFIKLKQCLDNEEILYNEEQISLLKELMKSTLETNEKFNLTAIKDEESFVEKMIFDSALGIRDLDLDDKTVIDVGTGAGFPGMVIRILCSKAKVTLLDSTKKKIDYLKEFADNHSLKIEGVSERAEDYARNNREKYDFAFARAVAPLNILLELIVPLLKVGGEFVAMKGPGFEEEINQSSKALKKLNCSIKAIYETELPECHEKRAIIRIIKNKETNKTYPRLYKDIKNMPL